MSGRIALVLFALGFVTVATARTTAADDAASDFLRADRGLEAYRRVDFAAALNAWLPLARRGDARAQTWIGVMHAEGAGMPRDHAAAMRWLDRAAGQGYAEAEFRLGVIHEFGHGMPENKARARAYYERAAEHAHVEAQIRLSEIHEFGTGTPVDRIQAFIWADIAARIASSHTQQVRAAGARDTIAEMLTPAQAAAARRGSRVWIERRFRAEKSSAPAITRSRH